jgi:hypothetical protein
MCRGTGSEFAARLAEFMGESGISEEQIGQFRRLNAHFPDTTISAKVDFSPDRPVKVQYYHHSLIPHFRVVEILRELSVAEKSITDFLDICYLLRNQNIYLGFHSRPGGGMVLKAFFHNFIGTQGQSLGQGIAAIMGKMGFSAPLISLFIDYHNFLATEPARGVFISAVFTSTLEQVIKIDYEDVPLEKVQEVYRSQAIPPDRISRLSDYCRELQAEHVTYFGIKYVDGAKPEFKCYFTRRYAMADDPSLLAEMLRETKWV